MARRLLALPLTLALFASLPVLFAEARPAAQESDEVGEVGQASEAGQAGESGQAAHAEGEWKDGKPDGSWSFFTATGDELVRARYRKGSLNGKFRLLWPSGEVRAETKYKRGKLGGELAFFSENGKRFEPWCGDYKLSATRWAYGEPRARGLLLDGAPHGIWEYKWPSGAPLLTAFFDRGEPVGTWSFFHLDGTPDAAFFGEPWSTGPVAEFLTGQPWKLFFEPLLDAPEGPQPFAKLLAPSPPTPATPVAPGALSALAPALFEAMDAKSLSLYDPIDPRAEALDTLTLQDLPQLLATLLDLDSSGSQQELAALFEGPVRKILVDTPMVPADAPLADLHLATRRLLAIWALVGDNPIWWDLHLTVSRVHTLSAHLRPIPKEALGATGGPPAPAFAGRFGDPKKQLRAFGKPWRASLDEGLRFLVSMQAEDGHWDGEERSEIGCTGLALLALAGDGNTIYAGPYADAVRRGAAWLYRHQGRMTGQIKSVSSFSPTSYGSLIATAALGELYGMAPSHVQRLPLEKALAFVADSRTKSSGWTYSGVNGFPPDASLSAWATLALTAGLEAGVSDADDSLHAALDGGLDFIESMLEPTTGRIGYNEPGSYSARVTGVNDRYPVEADETLTAIGMYALIRGRAVLAEREAGSSPGSWTKQVELLQHVMPKWDDSDGKTVMYCWLFATQALHLIGGRSWETWWAALEETAFGGQVKGTGAWAPIGPWGMYGGPSYSTAVMLLALEAPIR